MALGADTHSQISNLSAEGDALADAGNYRDAIATYEKAWDLIPEPKTEWNASTWILAAIADTAFLCGDHHKAREFLDKVFDYPEALGNPFLHLRRGQVLFDTGELDGAADELMRAYMGDGDQVFADEDPKYLAFLKTRAMID